MLFLAGFDCIAQILLVLGHILKKSGRLGLVDLPLLGLFLPRGLRLRRFRLILFSGIVLFLIGVVLLILGLLSVL